MHVSFRPFKNDFSVFYITRYAGIIARRSVGDGVRGTDPVRTIAGRHHRGRAAVRGRRVVQRAARPDRRVPGLYAVRRHPVRLRGQDGGGRPAQFLRLVRRRAAGVRRAVLVHARVARVPVQRGPAQRGGRGAQVSGRASWQYNVHDTRLYVRKSNSL